MVKDDNYYMALAIKEAMKAYKKLEVPIGAILVYNNEIIGKGHNKRNTSKSTFAHAEILAMKKGMEFLKDWRLEETTLYVTLEPCPMCAGAIVQARIPRVVIGAMNPKAGSAGSVINILEEPGFNHQVHLLKGIREEECKHMLQAFFKELRESKKKQSKLDLHKNDT
jgi:tRNA(adenine34) deaminase